MIDVKLPSANFAVKTGIVVGAGFLIWKFIPVTAKTKIASIFA